MTPEDRALIDRVPESLRAANGIPAARAPERQRAVEVIRDALGNLLLEEGVRISPLGPAWSADIDVHLKTLPESDELAGRGWLSLDGLLAKIGSSAANRWAVTENSRVLAGADLHIVPPYDVEEGIVARCRRRREVRAREVVELRVLNRSGRTLAHNEVVGTAARVEAGLGGSELSDYRKGPPLPAPAPLPGSRLLSIASRLKPRRRRRFVVALSGVDGAGKSTVARSLERDLRAAGIPVVIVWTRPGMGLKWLESIARFGKRILGQDAAPGIREIARGETAGRPRSRRGVLGWVWSVMITFSFALEVRRRHASATGVVIYDRHLLDALATLEFAYAGVNLGLQRAAIRRLLPRADLTFYLDIQVDEAVGRKPGDIFGEHAVKRQLEIYDRLNALEPTNVLDATLPVAELEAIVLRRVLASEQSPPLTR
ncbi:MAG: hypothetical protein M3280_03735 [Actinomycetota bacterium]|nr:hypothetical protein [Actinomycetota bacterium]